MNIRKILQSEDGISFATVTLFVAIVTVISISVAFLTSYHLTNTETQSKRTLAFNIAEAGVERLLGNYGQNFPTSIPTVKTVIYNNEALNGGAYTTSIIEDPQMPGYILITSTGVLDSHQRTIEVRVRGIPEVFNFAVASAASELELENDGTQGSAYALINGNIHANGTIDMDGGQIYVNTQTYNDGTGLQTNANYDSSWKVTATGSVTPNDPTYLGGYDPTDKSPVQFPKIDIPYYMTQANFTKQQVFIYSGSKDDWTVAEFNNTFTPTAPYTSSIVIFDSGRDINLTGSGTITSTIILGSNADNLRRLFVTADQGKSINFIPAIGMALVAERFVFTGTINVGTESQGAILIATERVEIEEESNGDPSNFIMWGSMVLGQAGDSSVDVEIDGRTAAANHFEINFTDSINRNLPSAWTNWGTVLMYKDNWRER